jgi:hypothetical protein
MSMRANTSRTCGALPTGSGLPIGPRSENETNENKNKE